MRHDDLRVLLIFGGHHDNRDPFLRRGKSPHHVPAHVEVELACDEKDRIVGLGTPGHDRHVEPIFCISSVDDSLVIAAMFRIGSQFSPKRTWSAAEAPAGATSAAALNAKRAILKTCIFPLSMNLATGPAPRMETVATAAGNASQLWRQGQRPR